MKVEGVCQRNGYTELGLELSHTPALVPNPDGPHRTPCSALTAVSLVSAPHQPLPLTCAQWILLP